MSATYPLNDGSSVVDAVNYLLSGPSGTGQNFAGNSSIGIDGLRPTYGYDPFYSQPPGSAPWIRPVFSTLNNWLVYVKSITNAVIVGSNPATQVTFTFSTPFTDPPFALGDQLYIIGITPADYNGYWTVFSSTTTEMVCFRKEAQTYPAFVSSVGGLVRDFRNVQQMTDMQAEVTVTGGSDRVIISSQGDILFAWYGATAPFRFDILVQVLRYKKQGPESPQQYVLDGVVIQRNYGIGTSGGFSTSGDNVVIPAFTSFIDGPNLDIGTYNYVLAVTFVTDPNLRLYGENGYLSTGYGSITSNNFYTSGIMDVFQPPTTYTGITPTITAYDGTVSTSTATLDITLTPDIAVSEYIIGYNTSVVVTAQSGDFHLNDLLTIPGTSLGGSSPLHDLTLKVSRITYPGSALAKDIILELRSMTAQVVKE